MNKKLKICVTAFLMSPFAFVTAECMLSIISFELLIMLFGLYFIAVLLLIVFVVLGLTRID